MVNRFFISVLLSLFVVMVSGCGSPTAEITAISPLELTPTNDTVSAYPYPAPTLYKPAYPEPQQGQSDRVETTPLPTVTRAPNTATVSAIILYNDEPVAHYTIYLADVVRNEAGEETVAAMRRLTSPRTATDENGEFTFRNVAPGKYGLILDTVQAAYLLHDPETNEQILFTLGADEDLDLGTINFLDLPIPEG